MNEWKCMVDNAPTFYGVYCDYYKYIARKWKAESTRSQNEKTYLKKIIPNIKDHDTKPIDAYIREDYDAVIDSIIKKGQAKESMPYEPYAESTIQTFRRLIYYVVDAAAKNGLCDNVLWESCYNPKVSTDDEEDIAKNALLSKSLTADQEIAVAKALLTDSMQVGQNMGLLLMYALGLRNAEACAIDFGDIKPMQNHPDCSVMWIYKTTGYDHNTRKLGGKSRNADRIIPIPDIVASLLSSRREKLENILGKSVDHYPIACVENQWEERCSARQLTSAARTLFQLIHMNAAQVSALDESLRESIATGLYFDETEPTAYLLRRNFGLHMAISGLTEAEIQYVIGHDIDSDLYETRNEFISEEKLYQISKKMAQRPLVNSSQHGTLSVIAGSINAIESNSTIRVSTEFSKIKIAIHSDEITDSLQVKIRCIPRKQILQTETDMYFSSQNNPNRSIDLRKQYHKIYCK